MRRIDISGTPAEEPCAQIGIRAEASDWSRQEAIAYRAALIAINGPPPHGYTIDVRANHHDFGTYYTLALNLPANPADRNEGYETAIETGLGHWHEAVMSPPIDYRDHEHPKPRHPTRAANESIIGAVLSTRPYPDGRFAIPIFETIHNNLTKAYPDLASAARLRLEDPKDQHAASLH